MEHSMEYLQIPRFHGTMKKNYNVPLTIEVLRIVPAYPDTLGNVCLTIILKIIIDRHNIEQGTFLTRKLRAFLSRK